MPAEAWFASLPRASAPPTASTNLIQEHLYASEAHLRLMRAAEAGDAAECLRCLREDTRDGYCVLCLGLALTLACRSGSIDTVTVLLDRGAPTDKPPDETTLCWKRIKRLPNLYHMRETIPTNPLVEACLTGDLALVRAVKERIHPTYLRTLHESLSACCLAAVDAESPEILRYLFEIPAFRYEWAGCARRCLKEIKLDRLDGDVVIELITALFSGELEATSTRTQGRDIPLVRDSLESVMRREMRRDGGHSDFCRPEVLSFLLRYGARAQEGIGETLIGLLSTAFRRTQEHRLPARREAVAAAVQLLLEHSGNLVPVLNLPARQSLGRMVTERGLDVYRAHVAARSLGRFRTAVNGPRGLMFLCCATITRHFPEHVLRELHARELLPTDALDHILFFPHQREDWCSRLG